MQRRHVFRKTKGKSIQADCPGKCVSASGQKMACSGSLNKFAHIAVRKLTFFFF